MGHIVWNNVHIIGVQEREEKGIESLFKEIMTASSLNLNKEMDEFRSLKELQLE